MALYPCRTAGKDTAQVDTRGLTAEINNFTANAYSDSKSLAAGTYLCVFGGAGGNLTLTIGTETITLTCNSANSMQGYLFKIAAITTVSVYFPSTSARLGVSIYKID